MADVRQQLSSLPGVQAFPVMRQGFGQRTQKPVQFVLGGGTYEDLARWRDRLINHVRENNPRLTAIESNYDETQPQLRVDIDYERAASLGVTVTEWKATVVAKTARARWITFRCAQHAQGSSFRWQAWSRCLILPAPAR